MARVLFYVQHLLGVGHVRRASLIAEAMASRGLDVHVVLGGAPVANISFEGCTCHRLPQASAVDSSFSHLVDETGNPVDDQWKNTRRDKLLSLYADLAPDVLFIEQFPFGRRQFRFELLPLLDTACSGATKPHVICSVRDILVTKNTPDKHRQTVAYINKYFDSVIVHGDPNFISFDTTFPLASEFGEKIFYSGYVAPPDHAPATEVGRNEVIVATGGGAVGAELMISAAHAKTESALSHLTWRFLNGPNLLQNAPDTILKLDDSGIIVEPNRRDYGTLLRNCTLSISQGGYNTMMDIVRARCSAIVIPFGHGSEDEQSRRSAMLHDRGYVTMISERDLSPASLIAIIDQAQSNIVPKQFPFSLDGAETTVDIISNMID